MLFDLQSLKFQCFQIITESLKMAYSPNSLPIFLMMLTGGLAACIAELITIPIDTAKIRLQIQGSSGKQYRGMIDCIRKMIIEEGVSSLFKGLSAGFQRQIIFASLRIGLYEPVKRFLVGINHVGSISMLYRIIAALITGGFAIFIANPTDVVKIRYQSEGKKPKQQQRYRTVFQAYTQIIRKQGYKNYNVGYQGLWTGVGPNIVRNSIVNAAEIATFDGVKEAFLGNGLMNDDISCYVVCSIIAGLTATIVGSPVDVLKTRLMNAKPTQYRSFFDCFFRICQEGIGSFYKGFQANSIRIISWNIIMFVALEELRMEIYQLWFSKII